MTTQTGVPARHTNVLAIVALVTAFVMPVLGIVFGVLARREIRRTGEDGGMFATWGIWIGAGLTVMTLVGAVLMIALTLRQGA